MWVLIVEDHLGIRTALEMILQMEGFNPISVDRGEDALDRLSSRNFDIVLLDLHTNGISAHEFMKRLEELNARPGFQRPLVGVLSGSNGIEFETRRIGADFSVRKPFDHEQLIIKLRVLQSKRGDVASKKLV